MDIDREESERRIGCKIKSEEIVEALKRLGILVGKKRGSVVVIPPPYRTDILHSVDLWEDVLIGFGLENVPRRIPVLDTRGIELPMQIKVNALRNLGIGSGFTEINTPVLGSEAFFQKPNSLRISNPVSGAYTVIRSRLLPNILEFLAKNTHHEYPQKIFEVGRVVVPKKNADEKSITNWVFGAAMAGEEEGAFARIKGLVEGWGVSLGLDLNIKTLKNEFFISGRSAVASHNK